MQDTDGLLGNYAKLPPPVMMLSATRASGLSRTPNKR
jgi:hypothetical protein